MELLQLDYFLKLANTQHVSQTAQKLHISQPALSATIKKLESELGTELFIRSGRNITLSPCGEIFKSHVEDALTSLENGILAVREMNNIGKSTLNLGILSPYIWTYVFQEFQRLFPQIYFNFFSIEGNGYFESLLTGEIDLYLGDVGHIDNIATSKFEYKTLYEDDMVLLVNNTHPLAGEKEIDLSLCGKEKFINLSASTNLQQFINTLYSKANILPDVVMVCDHTLRDRMVSENHGVSVTTKHSAINCPFENVTYLKIINPAVKRKLGLIWRRGKMFSKPMQNFYDVSCKIYSELESMQI